jgi:guanylate kinase
MSAPGLLLILSAPSGAGKSTVATRFLGRNPDFRLSVSHTTRPPRPREVDGEDYHFVDWETYERLKNEDAFLECAEVHGNGYGTVRSEAEAALLQGQGVLLDVDVQGGGQIKSILPDAVAAFLVPPSMQELERRLTGRRTESPEIVQTRLGNARRELEAANTYDYILVNKDLDDCVLALEAVVRAERARVHRRKDLLERLLEERR